MGRTPVPWNSGVRDPQVLQALDGPCLAGAVGADEADNLAGSNVEVQPIDGDPSAIGLGQPSNRDDGLGGRGS